MPRYAIQRLEGWRIVTWRGDKHGDKESARIDDTSERTNGLLVRPHRFTFVPMHTRYCSFMDDQDDCPYVAVVFGVLPEIETGKRLQNNVGRPSFTNDEEAVS